MYDGLDNGSKSYDSESSTDSEEEDDEGILASGALDEQVNATLQAIRARDPRVYDEKTTFYASVDDEDSGEQQKPKKSEKPMYLSDYHRENLLKGNEGGEEEEVMPATYAQEQDYLKRSIVREMHAAADQNPLGSPSEKDDKEDDDGFLVRKKSTMNGATLSKPGARITSVDVHTADRDPETFLSNFLAARAWVPSAGSQFQPFESDDEEEDDRADAFEAAYNLRFENPKGSNEKLTSHGRDIAAKYSVRRETTNSRKKARESEGAKKEAEKREREEEKARLRRLKIEEAEERIRKIKEAAGLRGKTLDQQDWSRFLEDGWDDQQWEAEMKKRFGDDYYADQDFDESATEEDSRKKKAKKPKWKDEIDIKDLVPDFDAEEELQKPPFTLSEASDTEDMMDPDPINGTAQSVPDKKSRKRERESQKKESRKQRRRIEQLVDANLTIDHALSTPSNSTSNHKNPGRFRYRETSPSSYGLTAHDILLASDTQLNQYVGLKKMAAFRDADKKRRDKKMLGKKARLRQWRKETFGSEEGPRLELKDVLTENDATATKAATATATNGDTGKSFKADEHSEGAIREGAKKRKRSRKSTKGM